MTGNKESVMRIIIATQCVNIGYLLLYLVCENDGYNERERERAEVIVLEVITLEPVTTHLLRVC